MSPNHLLARQTPQSLATTLTQPTTTLALSTTFTPPASCALPSQVTILPPPGYLIWWNEPVPYPSMTMDACYPSEFLESYTSIPPTTSFALGSSIVPAMSPLVCPDNFCTQYVGADNYIACCPSGYKFATTGSPVVASRPAYGGVCYTDIPLSQELTAVMFDSTGSSHQEVWAPSTMGAQGWAHPIDGWATGSAVVGCAVKRATSSGGSGSSSSSAAPSEVASTSPRPLSSVVSSAKARAKKTSGGVIAGAVLGALVGLAVILALVLLLLRRRKRARKDDGEGRQLSHSDDGTLCQVEGAPIHEKDGDTACLEVGAVAAKVEMPASGRGAAHELGSEHVYEMPAGSVTTADQRQVP